MEKKGTPASPAIARASKVLPVPGDQRGERHGEYARLSVGIFVDLEEIRQFPEGLPLLHQRQQHLQRLPYPASPLRVWLSTCQSPLRDRLRHPASDDI